MLSALVSVFSAVVGWLVSLLPVSISSSLSLGSSAAVETALGWINWLMPVQQMLGLMSVWLAGLLLASAVLLVRNVAFVGGFLGGGA